MRAKRGGMPSRLALSEPDRKAIGPHRASAQRGLANLDHLLPPELVEQVAWGRHRRGEHATRVQRIRASAARSNRQPLAADGIHRCGMGIRPNALMPARRIGAAEPRDSRRGRAGASSPVRRLSSWRGRRLWASFESAS